MSKINDIINELTVNPPKGEDLLQPAYSTGPAQGAAGVENNLSLINDKTVRRYMLVAMTSEIKKVFDGAELRALGANDRSDFDSFVTNLFLHGEFVENPSGTLQTLINQILGAGSASATAFDLSIQEFVSPAEFIGIGQVVYSEMEESMSQLGWL